MKTNKKRNAHGVPMGESKNGTRCEVEPRSKRTTGADLSQVISDLYAQGLRCFPVEAGGKISTVKAWQHFDDMAKCIAHVAGGGNYGVVAGENFAFLDVDMHGVIDGKASYAALIKAIPELSLSISVTTPRNGHHTYLALPKEFKGKISKELDGYPGVDFLTGNHYVVGAGSATVAGGYGQVGSLTPVMLSVATCEALSGLSTSKTVEAVQAEEKADDSPENIKRFTDYVGRIGFKDSGQGSDDHTYKVMCQGCDFGLSSEAMVEALLTLEGWNTFDAGWLESKATASKNRQNTGTVDPLIKFDALVSTGDFSIGKLKESMGMKRAYAMSLGKEEWYYRDIVQAKQVTTIVSEPNGGKTAIFFYHVAPKMAADGVDVIYVDFDAPASSQLGMLDFSEENKFTLLHPDSNDVEAEGFIKFLTGMRQNKDTRLDGVVIIIDTLKKVADMMSKQDLKKIYKLMKNLTQKGATLIALAHSNKHLVNGRLVHEGTGDVRADSDCLIFLEHKLINPADKNDGIIVTSDTSGYGTKTRGEYSSISFRVEKGVGVNRLDKTVHIDIQTKKPRVKDDDILNKTFVILSSRGATSKGVLVDIVAGQLEVGVKRVKSLLEFYADEEGRPRDDARFRKIKGNKNTILYEVKSNLAKKERGVKT